MLDYVLSLIARFFNLALTALPIGAALAIGRFFGRMAYVVNYRRAKVAYANMRAAFGREKEPSEMRAIVKKLYENFGQMLVEVLRIPSMDKAYIDKYVEIPRWDNFTGALKKGRGVIYLTGHFGNWELCSITSALRGFPIFVLAREQKMVRLNNLLNIARESKGCKVIKKGMATREIYEHLGRNGVVGILSDQDAGKKAVFINFFGRPTSTPRGAFALAKKTRSLIVPAFAVRIKGPFHRIFLEPPIEVADEGGQGAGELEAMQKFALIMESYIRKHPEQWLWLHKRWKSTPLRKVAILSDGKKGHLNQSLAVFERIKELRIASGYREADTDLRIIEISYRSAPRRIFMAALLPLFSNSCLLREWLMRGCLDSGCLKALKETYADIVISCGSRTAPVNVLFSRENCAKNAAIMKPSLVSVRNFDIAVIPEHDRPPRRENILKTRGAPNLISPQRMENDFAALRREIELGAGKNIGVFIGGDNKNYLIDVPMMEEVIKAVSGAALELGANVLIATSRRTSDKVGDFLKAGLSGSSRVKLLIIAKERNPEWAVAGILAASSVVVVSGESASMLSEAASSGRHVVAFLPRRRPYRFGAAKHEAFLKKLALDGFVHLAQLKDIKDDIIALADSPDEPKKLNDNERIYEAMRRVV